VGCPSFPGHPATMRRDRPPPGASRLRRRRSRSTAKAAKVAEAAEVAEAAGATGAAARCGCGCGCGYGLTGAGPAGFGGEDAAGAPGAPAFGATMPSMNERPSKMTPLSIWRLGVWTSPFTRPGA
jgi:hypothetical protein